MKNKLFILLGILFLIPLSQAALFDGIQLYYNFNSSQELISGVYNLTANEGSAVFNETSCLRGKCGQTWANNNMKIASNSISNFTGNYTMNLWVRGILDTANPYFMGSPTNGKQQMGWDSPTAISISASWTGTPENLGTVGDQTYFMISVVGRDGNVTVYVNGSVKAGGLSSAATQEDLYLGNIFNGIFDWHGQFDEFGYWNRALAQSEITTLYNGGLGLEFNTQTDVGISLISPANGASLGQSSVLFNASLTPGLNSNLTNGTLYLYNSTGSLVNLTTRALSGNVINYTTINVTNLATGNYVWNILGCETNGSAHFCNFNSMNSTFSIGFSFNSITYTTPVLGSQENNFTLNISVSGGVTSSSAVLIYNNTRYTSTKNSTANYLLFTNSITAPSVSAQTNKSFYWEINIDGTLFNTTFSNQTVNPLQLNICSPSLNNTILNFTLKDEISQATINSVPNKTDFQATFRYSLSGSGSQNTFNYSALNTNVSSFAFCITSNISSINLDLQVDYGSDGYQPRQYFLTNATIVNTSSAVNLFLLSEDLAVKFFNTVTLGTDFIEDATVQISKFFVGEGAFKQIGVRQTDEVGDFIEYLELDKTYRYTVIKDGEVLGVIERESICATAPCEQILELTNTFADLNERFNEVFGDNVVYTISFNQTTKIVEFVFSDTTGLANYFRLEVLPVKVGTDDPSAICDTTLNSPSGSISCNMTAFTSGEFKATAYVSRSPEAIVTIYNFIIQNAAAIFGTLGIWISLLVLVTIIFTGLWNPVVMVALIPIALIVLKLMQFLPFGWPIIAGISLVAIYLIGRIKT